MLQAARRAPLFIEDGESTPKELFLIPPHYVDCVESVLIPHGLVIDRVQRLAADIRADYPDSVPHLLCVLKVSEGAARHLASLSSRGGNVPRPFCSRASRAHICYHASCKVLLRPAPRARRVSLVQFMT